MGRKESPVDTRVIHSVLGKKPKLFWYIKLGNSTNRAQVTASIALGKGQGYFWILAISSSHGKVLVFL